MSKKYDENVLVFHSSIFFDAGLPSINGLGFRASEYIEAIFDPKYASRVKMMDRNIAETCELWKQIIPYILVRTTTESGENRYLCYRRGKSGGENRLHDKYSIGFGGHVNDVDAVYDNGLNIPLTIINNIRREIAEEINLPLTLNAQPVGVIFSNVTPVDRVHFGVVFIFDTNQATAQAMEDCIEKPEFYSVEDLKNINLENWSRLVLENLL